jgi:hypothetical protein
VHAGERLRVVRVLDAPEFPAFYRVIWNEHVAEMSDLACDRAHLMDAVLAVEHAARQPQADQDQPGHWQCGAAPAPARHCPLDWDSLQLLHLGQLPAHARVSRPASAWPCC